MGQWIKANGGPLAFVVLGLTVGGFTNRQVGVALVVVGVAWYLGASLVRGGLKRRVASKIEEGSLLHGRFFSERKTSEEWGKEYGSWQKEATSVFKRHPILRARFSRAHSGTAFKYQALNHETSNLATSLDEDLRRLDEILKELP